MRARGAAGWYAFAVEGLSLEKLLNRCAQEGIRLRRVCRCGAKRATGSVRAADWAALSALCERMGFRLTQGEASGPVRLAGLFRRRALLVTGVLAFLVLLWGLTSCLWFVRVTGAGPYAGEVARILQAHEIRPGRLRYTLDVAALQRDLHSQLTGLAWVGVEVSGVYLTVSCVQAEPADEAQADGPADLVAARDGVVRALRVYAGTPLVQAGDVVRKGQVLVRGEERAFDGAVTPVRAAGEVEARVWYTGEATVSGTLLQTEPTGRVQEARTLCTPFFQIAFEEGTDFTDYDTAWRALPLGGIFPVWLRVARYEEVERRAVARPEEEVREEVGRAAWRLAQQAAGFHAQVVDKWIEYSMIKEGGYRALAVLETVENIAVAPEERTDELEE